MYVGSQLHDVIHVLPYMRRLGEPCDALLPALQVPTGTTVSTVVNDDPKFWPSHRAGNFFFVKHFFHLIGRDAMPACLYIGPGDLHYTDCFFSLFFSETLLLLGWEHQDNKE